MGDILRFPSHARASSTGYKSGRNSWRETPVARSIGKTNSPGTPFRERSSQYQTCDCVVPIWSAKGFCPPATSQARRSASFDMDTFYTFLGSLQPTKQAAHDYRNLDKICEMLTFQINKKEMAARFSRRMEVFRTNPNALATITGISVNQIQKIAQNGVEKSKHLKMLATLLMTTEEWLLYGTGPEDLINPSEAMLKLLGHIDHDKMLRTIFYIVANELAGPEERVNFLREIG